MGHMEEDRIYADRLGKSDVFVATEMGVAVVSVSNDRIGQFSLDHRCLAHDVAATGGRLLVATDEDVLLVEDATDRSYETTGFGPAVAVGFPDGPVAAGPDGRVARYHEEREEWERVGTVGDVRAIDGDLLAAGDGVYRVGENLEHVGLDDARDISTAGTPLAATGDGLYRLGPGWTRDIDGVFTVVAGAAANENPATDSDRAHAATDETLYERVEGAWKVSPVPADDPLVDVGYVADGGVVAVTAAGQMLIDPVAAKDGATGWRSRSLGLPGLSALAVPE